MGFVRSFTFTPSPRSDGFPWTAGRIEESAAEEGPYAAIQTIPLDPLDPDPRAPSERTLTTTEATLEAGWYRVVFLDAGGNEEITEAVRAPDPGPIAASLPPTTDQVRERSELLRIRYPAPDPGDPDPLLLPMTDAVALVSALTCRILDELISCPGQCEPVPAGMEGLALRAVTLKTEQLAVGGTAKVRQRRIGSGNLRSFTAGRYSESYFGPEEAAKARQLDPDPAVHETLWALATEECRDAWMALWGGQAAPASAITTFGYGPRGPVGGY